MRGTRHPPDTTRRDTSFFAERQRRKKWVVCEYSYSMPVRKSPHRKSPHRKSPHRKSPHRKSRRKSQRRKVTGLQRYGVIPGSRRIQADKLFDEEQIQVHDRVPDVDFPDLSDQLDDTVAEVFPYAVTATNKSDVAKVAGAFRTMVRLVTSMNTDDAKQILALIDSYQNVPSDDLKEQIKQAFRDAYEKGNSNK